MKKVWSYEPVDYRTWPSLSEPQVQTVTIKSGLTTSKISFFFSNLNGVSDLHLIKLKFILIRSGKIINKFPILFSGENELTMKMDQELYSDPILAEIKADDFIQIKITLPERCYLTSGVVTYSLLNLRVENERLSDGKRIDQLDYCKMVQDNPRMTYFVGVTGIEMMTPKTTQIVTVFGDSITQQGFFVNHLRNDLQTANSNCFMINNCGIGGNRVLFDTDPMMDKWYRHGIAGINRFENDVFKDSSPDVVVVFHGINDIIQETAHPGDVEDMNKLIEGLTKYAKIIKEHQAKSFICTLLPLGRSRFYSDHVEKNRQLINEWIRNQNIYDHIIDLDKVGKNILDSRILNHEYDSGDGLHPNDFGGATLAGEASKVILRHCNKQTN